MWLNGKLKRVLKDDHIQLLSMSREAGCESPQGPAHLRDPLTADWRRSVLAASDAGALDNGNGENLPGAFSGGSGEEP